jgi:GPH family glycoside/pentoside/hexuronide:cation symporter
VPETEKKERHFGHARQLYSNKGIFMTASTGIWKQRIGYGVADTACNLVWQMLTLYIMFFYTDVMKLPATAVGVMFLATRLVDGVADVMMGILIDNTKSKWGKSRPYFLWGAIPFGLIAVATFYVPDVGPTGKLIWAYITYMGLSLLYTVVNIPLASILPALTSDPHERTVLATTRMVFSFLGATIISSVAMPMIEHLGNGDKAHGYLVTMSIWAAVATLLFLFTFKTVEEKVLVQQDKIGIATAFKALKGNTPWKVFALNIVVMWGAVFFQGGALIYYITYNLAKPDLVPVIAGIGAFVPMIGTLSTPFFSKRMKKINVFMIASSVVLGGTIMMLLVGNSTVGLIAGAIVLGLGMGLRTSIYFSMQADPIDFGEWKSGVNAAGLLSAVNGFIGKIAFACAGAAAGYLLSSGGYVPDQQQTPEALDAIKMCYFIIPIGLIILSMFIMKTMYKLDYIFPQIRAELDQRNLATANKNAAAPVIAPTSESLA